MQQTRFAQDYTEDECKDAAMMSGLTEHEGVMYYVQYKPVGFVDGCNRPIKDLRAHMRKLKLTGGLLSERVKQQEQNKRVPFYLQGKKCDKCRKQATFAAVNDMGYDYFRCEEHEPPNGV